MGDFIFVILSVVSSYAKRLVSLKLLLSSHSIVFDVFTTFANQNTDLASAVYFIYVYKT